MCPRQAVEVGHGHAPGALGAVQLDAGVQRGERDGHVRGVGGDAVRGVPEHRVVPVHALTGAATTAGRPLVAGFGDVLEVGAAGALEQVATRGGRVAQLARGAREQGLGEDGITGADGRMGREIAVADRGADAERAVRELLDLVQGQAADVDEQVGPFDAEFHQVDQVGAAAEVAGAGVGGEEIRRLFGAGGPYVVEGLHRITSSTASTMRG